MLKSQIESESNPKTEKLKLFSGEQMIQSQNQPSQGESSLSYLNPQMMSKQDSCEVLENQNDQQKTEVHPERFIGPLGKPRTANKAFGGISDFTLFFENRNPEMTGFIQQFKYIEKMNLKLSIKGLNKIIVPKIDECLNKMYKKSGSKLKNKYADIFTRTFEKWEDFYEKILYAYTIAGFLYEKMNEFLRNEDWEQLDDLLPYTYSLFKAFLWGPTSQEFSKNFEFLKSISNENKLILYRGADFDDDSLKFYSDSKIKYFAWNGVTSSSLDKSIAQKFQNNSSTKTPVLITIEIDFNNLKPQDLNALYLEGISNHPREREVALPPGSIFELMNKSEQESEVAIKLKLVTNVKELAEKGQFMHGMLQTVMGEEDRFKIICLREKELSRAIKHCKGNSLITNFDFFLCNFNQWSAKLLRDVLPTMKSLRSFTFNSVVFESDCLDQIMECLGNQRLIKLEIVDSLRDDNNLESFIGCLKFFGSLENLKLGFQENHQINDHLIRKLKNEVNQYLDIKCIFELSFLNAEEAIVKGLRKNNHPPILESWLEERRPTNLCFLQEKQESSSERNVLELIGMKNRLGYSFEENSHAQKSTFQEALEEKFPEKKSRVNESPLEELNIIFKASQSTYDQDLKNLEWKGIQGIQSIKTLNLSFNYKFKITDKVLQILRDLILQLKELSSLHLNFHSCSFRNEEGLRVSDLHDIALNLSFKRLQITERELWDLRVRWTTELRSLTSLYINFNSSHQKIDQELENLFENSEKMQNLELLSDLQLNFNGCSITDKGLEILSDKGLKNLKNSLKILNLNFEKCEKITDTGIEVLCSQGIQCLQKLNTLYLKFQIDKRFRKSDGTIRDEYSREKWKHLVTSSKVFSGIITDQSLESLGFYGIQHLRELQTLDLNFDGQGKITLEGIKILCLGGIQHLKKLSVLHLSFRSCPAINDEGLHILSCEGLARLKHSLNQLELDFSDCFSLSDRGLMDLYSTGIKNLSSLTTLSLKFENCPRMSKVELFSSQIKLLKLPQFKLSFKKFSEKEEDNLRVFLPYNPNTVSVFCQDRLEFYHLTNKNLFEEEKFQKDQTVENLTLKLDQNYDISNLDLSESIFSSGKMKIFKNLKTLSLNFDNQSQITDTTLQDLCFEGLQNFKSLTSLHLSFCKCSRMTDTGFQILGSAGIKHLKSLVNLYLNFSGCSLITDKGIQALEEIKNLSLVDALSLSFERCERISDQGIMNLYCSRIKCLRSLRSLFLNFDYEITNETIKKFYDYGMKHLKSSKLMHLIFRLRDKLRSVTLDFQGVKSQDSIFISFDTDTKIPEMLKGQILQSFGSLILRSSNKWNTIGLAKSKLRRQGVCIQNSLSEIKPANRDSVEIFVNRKFTRYIGTNLYVLKVDARDAEYQNDFNRQENQDNIFTIIKKDIIALAFLSSFAMFERKAQEYIQEQSAQDLSYLQSLTSLYITIRRWKQSRAEFIFHLLCLKVFPRLESLIILHLNFGECLSWESIGITDVELTILSFQGIRLLKSLKNLHLHFDQCRGITDVGFASLLTDGIQSLDLMTLELSFQHCPHITDVGLARLLTDRIQSIDLLTTLKLSFKYCPQITDRGFRNLNGQDLKSLNRLYLNFGSCKNFTDEGVKNLCIRMRQHLKKLTIFHLHFENCDGVTDDGFQYLSQGISHLKLETLSLNLSQNWSITGQGIQHLNFPDTQSFTALHLNFDQCHKLTDQALKDLKIKNLTSLKTLNLCFDKCRQITDEGIKDLCENGIQPLKQLKTFHLSFILCENLTEKGLESLINHGIKHLTELANIFLCFTACKQISVAQLSSLQNQIHSFSLPHLPCPLTVNDYKTIFSEPKSYNTNFLDDEHEIAHGNVTNGAPLKLQSHLSAANLIQKSSYCYQGEMEHPKELETLEIVFDHYDGTETPKLLRLCSKILKHIRSLKKLHISFRNSWKILCTDYELIIIGHAIQHLVELTELHLSFNHQYITDIGLVSLSSKSIKNLKQLNSLYLSFNRCGGITDKGLASLCSDGIQNLKVLNTLYLSFDECKQITDEALKSLSLKGLSNLSSIKNLELSFHSCPKISNSSYQAFLKILSYFGYVEAHQSSSKLRR